MSIGIPARTRALYHTTWKGVYVAISKMTGDFFESIGELGQHIIWLRERHKPILIAFIQGESSVRETPG